MVPVGGQGITGCHNIQTGDRIVFVTDGVTEAMSPQGEQLGRARLREVLEARGSESGPVLESLLHVVAEHRGDAAQSDDLTIAVITI